MVSFKKEEGMYENCFSNFVKFQLIFEEVISGTPFIRGVTRITPLFILKMRILLSK